MRPVEGKSYAQIVGSLKRKSLRRRKREKISSDKSPKWKGKVSLQSEKVCKNRMQSMKIYAPQLERKVQ